MRNSLLCLMVLLCNIGVCRAQSRGYTLGSWYQAGVCSLNGKSEFKSVDLVVAPGYAFNDTFFARLQADLTIGLFDLPDGRKEYRTNGTLGPSLGCNLIKNPHWGILETTVTVGNTINNSDWSFMYYDLGVGLAFPSQSKMKMLIGCGVRYLDSHKSAFDDYFNMYVNFGFRFN